MIYYNKFVVSTALHDVLVLPTDLVEIIIDFVYHPFRTRGGISYFLYLS